MMYLVWMGLVLLFCGLDNAAGSDIISDDPCYEEGLTRIEKVLSNHKDVLKSVTEQITVQNEVTRDQSLQLEKIETRLVALADKVSSIETKMEKFLQVMGSILGNTGHEDPCQRTIDEEGYVVFQKRFDGSVDFYRNWANYTDGFGDPSGEFWLGNTCLHSLTSINRSFELRIDLFDDDGSQRYATYQNFKIASEEEHFAISFDGYAGDAGDSLANNNGRGFTTYDQDNDDWTGNCAKDAYFGAWWYTNDCGYSNLNGRYGDDGSGEGINWAAWKGFMHSLPKTVMRLKPK